MGLTKVSSVMLDTLVDEPLNPAKGMLIVQEPTPGVVLAKFYNGTTFVPLGSGAVGAVGNYAFFENDVAITGDYTITAGKNAITAGPVDVANGVEVTVPTGSEWSIV